MKINWQVVSIIIYSKKFSQILSKAKYLSNNNKRKYSFCLRELFFQNSLHMSVSNQIDFRESFHTYFVTILSMFNESRDILLKKSTFSSIFVFDSIRKIQLLILLYHDDLPNKLFSCQKEYHWHKVLFFILQALDYCSFRHSCIYHRFFSTAMNANRQRRFYKTLFNTSHC